MARPFQILHLEDDPDYSNLVKGMLETDGLGVEILRVDNLADFSAALANNTFDVILADYRLPTCTGLQALQTARQSCPDAPFLLLSGAIGEQAAIESLKCGATDYVLKNWPERLVPAVRRALQQAGERVQRKRAESERKQAEDALRQREEYFRALAEQAMDVTAVLDADGTIRYESPSVERVLGYVPSDLLGRNSFDFVHPEEVPRIRQLFAAGIAVQDSTATEEFRFRHKDGSWRVLEIVARNLLDNPSVKGVIVNSRDITERRRTEEIRQRLAAAAEQAAETIVITDVQGAILYVNPAFEKTTGYTREEALGQNPRLLKSGKHDPALYKELWSTLVRGGIWTGHFVNKRKDGSFYEEDATITPVRDATGKVVNYVAVKHDVSNEVRLEAQLRQAQKMEAVGQLAGGVAHDFNNLLAVIRGGAELVLMDAGPLSVEAVGCLNQIVRASESAANLTRQLLVFSRKQLMRAQPLGLNDLIRNLTKMLKRIIPENNHMECLYAEELPFSQIDPGMLEQVLLNLVVNARDAMPHGGQLQIATEKITFDETCADAHAEARPGEFVCLRVSDTGTGIAPEHLQRIFEPFFTTKEPGKGTGLGLATVYGIVKQHQGWVEVASRIGEGTTFKIFLPAISPPAEAVAALQAAQELRGGTETILLVEDDYSVRMITRRVLETFHYKVLEATCAREALEVSGQHAGEIALLLTDIVLPEAVTGRDLAERLRTLRLELKVIFMSGYSAEVVGKDTAFFQKAKSRFLHKPFSNDTLIRTVRQCLDEK